MKTIDERIEKALREEDARIREMMKDDPSIFELVADTFRGRNRYIVYLGYLWGLVIAGLMFYCAVQFLRAEELAMMLRWGMGILVCLTMTLGIKIWYWMELNKNQMLREIKRVELQLARVSTNSPE